MDLFKDVQRFAQECIQKLPVIVLGSGASVPHGIPGMVSLGNHLIASKLPDELADIDRICWGKFCEILPTSNLESALTEVALTEAVTQHIVSVTWHFLNTADTNIFMQVVANRQLLPLSRLFSHLFQSTSHEIQVVTPNYDRIAEYAAEAAGYAAYTGFSFGLLGQRSQQVPKISYGNKQARTVKIWKVHGSFGWFGDQDGVVVSLPPMASVPSGLHPVIVTPGSEKYRRTHAEPFRTTINNADTAIGAASSFLCIGYGFNDEHLQPRLVERCSADNVPIVLITRSVSQKAQAWLRSGKCRQYLALEASATGTRVFSNDLPDGGDLPDCNWWELQNFLKLIG
jgi:hypothetical protein